MSQLTLTPHDKWRSTKCSLDCVCQNGIWLVPCTDPMCDVPGGYLTAKFPPNYPVPATLLNADVATTHRWLCGHCPNDDGPCNVCIDEFVDAMEYYQYPFFELT